MTSDLSTDRTRWLARHGPDLAALVGLVVGAFVLRWGGLSSDGLWYDDAWVAIGATEGSLSEIPMTGGGHAGFTLLLWIQDRLVGGDAERLMTLTFLFGVIGPAVLFGCLRSLRYGRAASLLAAAALLVTRSHVIYSARVKSYTFDVVLIAALAAVLPRVADRRWTWAGAAGWVAAAVVVGSISGYVMLATAIAIGILVLHAHGDRWQRAAALAVQGAIQGGWVLYVRRFADMDEIEEFMESAYDAHVERSSNPLELGRNLLRHMERVVDVHPGAPSAVLGVLAVAVLAGLVAGSLGRLDRSRAVVSRFALASVGVAALGAMFDRFPFGPQTDDLSSVLGAPGARHGLWLVPATAVGVCNLIEIAMRSAGRQRAVAGVISGVVLVLAGTLVVARWDPADPYGEPGGRRLAAMVEHAAERGAFIVLDEQTAYQYVVITDTPVRLHPQPEEMVGFVPELEPDQGTVLGPVFTPEEVGDLIATSDHDTLVMHGLDFPYDSVLLDAGWTREATEEVAGLRVTIWRAS